MNFCGVDMCAFDGSAPHRPWPENEILHQISKMKVRQLVLLGKRIRACREAAHLSQDKLAALAGLDRAYYGRIERGERNVAAINLMKIAAALDVDVGEGRFHINQENIGIHLSTYLFTTLTYERLLALLQ